MQTFTDIFSRAGQKKFIEFLTNFPDALLAFDFDGTLAPIVEKPEDAVMDAETFNKLERLAGLHTVVILTGRSVDDVRARLPAGIFRVIGSHGLEGHPDITDEFLSQAKSIASNWRRDLGHLLEDLHRVWIEDKSYSLAIHFRMRASSHDLPQKILDKCAQISPSPEIILGKNVINLIPHGMPNKLGALLALMQELHSRKAFFIGDDVTDEFVFAAKNENIFSVKVGHKSPLSAEHFIRHQKDIGRLLDCLLEKGK